MGFSNEDSSLMGLSDKNSSLVGFRNESSTLRGSPNENIRSIDCSKENSILGETQPSCTTTKTQPSSKKTQHSSTRCATCRKKTGLMSFKCKCDEGLDFCIKHRYPEDHSCSYDFRSIEKENLVKKNPVVNPIKLEKI